VIPEISRTASDSRGFESAQKQLVEDARGSAEVEQLLIIPQKQSRFPKDTEQ